MGSAFYNIKQTTNNHEKYLMQLIDFVERKALLEDHYYIPKFTHYNLSNKKLWYHVRILSFIFRIYIWTKNDFRLAKPKVSHQLSPLIECSHSKDQIIISSKFLLVLNSFCLEIGVFHVLIFIHFLDSFNNLTKEYIRSIR